MIKAFAFDLDGTLLNSFPSYFRALDEIFREFERPFETAYQHEALTRPLRDFFADRLAPRHVAAAQARLTALSHGHAPDLRAFEGVVEILEHLKQQEYKVAVWTNRDRETTLSALTGAGIRDYFAEVVSRDCVSKPKPDSEGLLKIALAFGCRTFEVCMVGDHRMDMEGAKRGGATAVRASWHGVPGLGNEERCEVADHQFFGIPEFERWIRQKVGPTFWL